MYGRLTFIKDFFKANAIVSDNFVYRLHYKVTISILFVCMIMVQASEHFGDPINCIPLKNILPEKTLNTFCWSMTTFSVESAWKLEIGTDVVYPGVINSRNGIEKRVYHAYYQWVALMLFFLAMLFYVPHFIWKSVEGRRIKDLVLELDNPVLSDDIRQKNTKVLVDYLYNNLNSHNTLFWVLCLTEVLNFLNVILQMKLIDWFLGGEFSSYGWEVLKFTEWEPGLRYDPMVKVFPRLTKCIFFIFGPSGEVQKTDTLCLLPINVLNEKIFIFLWFWYYILAILSFGAIIYRITCIASRRFRYLATISRLPYYNALKSVYYQCGLGDWYILHTISKNVHPMHFRDVIKELLIRMNGEENSNALMYHD